jgi:hypothetical protein
MAACLLNTAHRTMHMAALQCTVLVATACKICGGRGTAASSMLIDLTNVCPAACNVSIINPILHTLWFDNHELTIYRHYGETWPRSSPGSFNKAPETDMSRPGFEPSTSCTAGGHFTKELLQHICCLLFGTSTK